MIRFQTTDEHTDNMEGQTAPPDKNREFARLPRTRSKIFYGVAASPAYRGKHGAEHHPKEIGEFQGYIYYYPADKRLVTRLRSKGMLPESDLPVIERSSARHPYKRAGQMASAGRNTAEELMRMNATIDAAREQKQNRTGAAEAMLEQSATDNPTETQSLEPNFVVISRIDPSNTSAIEAIKAQGYEEIGPVSNRNDSELLFKLNWEKVAERLHKDADKEFLGTLGINEQTHQERLAALAPHEFLEKLAAGTPLTGPQIPTPSLPKP